MNTTESMDQRYLRPEARPFSWAALNDTQRTAFATIARAMAEAVQALDRPSPSSPSPGSPFLDKDRSNQTLFLCGGRGTGKTSLLLSLQHCVAEAKTWTEEIDAEERHRKACQAAEGQSEDSARPRRTGEEPEIAALRLAGGRRGLESRPLSRGLAVDSGRQRPKASRPRPGGP